MAVTYGLTKYEEHLTVVIHKALILNSWDHVYLGKDSLVNGFGSLTKAFESLMTILQAMGRIYWRKFRLTTDPDRPDCYRIETDRD